MGVAEGCVCDLGLYFLMRAGSRSRSTGTTDDDCMSRSTCVGDTFRLDCFWVSDGVLGCFIICSLLVILRDGSLVAILEGGVCIPVLGTLGDCVGIVLVITLGFSAVMSLSSLMVAVGGGAITVLRICDICM